MVNRNEVYVTPPTFQSTFISHYIVDGQQEADATPWPGFHVYSLCIRILHRFCILSFVNAIIGQLLQNIGSLKQLLYFINMYFL